MVLVREFTHRLSQQSKRSSYSEIQKTGYLIISHTYDVVTQNHDQYIMLVELPKIFSEQDPGNFDWSLRTDLTLGLGLHKQKQTKTKTSRDPTNFHDDSNYWWTKS